MKNFYSIIYLFLASISLLQSKSSSAQLMNFNNSVLIAGVDNTQGATYRFQNILSGVDAILTVDSIVNGAILKDIDKNGWGYTEAFQPFIQPPNGINTSAYIVFTMKFVTAATTNQISLPVFSMTSLDIDGNNSLKEFDIINMNGGSATYNVIPSEIKVIASGSGFKGINTAGNEHGGPDTTQKTDIFTVTNINVSQLTIKAGTEGITTSNAARKYSFFPAGITYPNTKFILPVKLTSFTAMLNNNNKVDLKWETATEINVSHFIVEKSTDGKNFSDAGMVFAYGNTTSKSNYVFADNISNMQSSVIYYRLKSVDVDSKTQFSDVRIIRISKQGENVITILTYPNPVSNEVRITIPANWQNKKVVYEMFSVNGQIAKKIETTNSSQTETMNVSNLNSGLYFVKVTCEGQTAQQKIVKQ